MEDLNNYRTSLNGGFNINALRKNVPYRNEPILGGEPKIVNVGQQNSLQGGLENRAGQLAALAEEKKMIDEQLSKEQTNNIFSKENALNSIFGKLLQQYNINSESPEAKYGKIVKDKKINGKMFNSATGLSGNKAFRNNNPGNITGMSGKLLYGAAGVAHSKFGDKGDQKQLFYNTPEEGTKAMYQLMRSDKYNNAPISQAFSKWQSNQNAWEGMKNEYRNKGIDVDRKRFIDLSPQQQYDFMNIRARHEGFSKDIPNIFIT